MAILSAEQFRAAAAQRRKTEDVEVEGVGTIRLRAISAGDAQRFQREVRRYEAEGLDPEELSFTLVARSWVGEDGDPWMPEDVGVEFAKSLDPETFNLLASAVLKLNGFGEAAVEEAVKNSKASRKGSSPSGSPKSSDTPT